MHINVSLLEIRNVFYESIFLMSSQKKIISTLKFITALSNSLN